MKDKIAFVCQRYGLEVNGGAELYCRQMAEKLSTIYDVEVFTTCAVDYITWKNEYQPGTETINNVVVHRYPVKHPRSEKRFAQISGQVLGNLNHSDAEEAKWIDEQGPLCDALLQELSRVHKEYRAVIFMTYLYYLTVKGMLLGFDNAILIPTVHDEPPVYLRVYDKVFSSAKGIIWNTVEEEKFAHKRFCNNIRNTHSVLAGIGVDVPEGELPEIPEMLKGQDYITYAGRIDESKGCGEMFSFFRRYRQEFGRDIKLVLMGKPVMSIPEESDIIPLGFVSNEMKFAVMRSAKALVLFSQFESLSMVVLESMTMGRPVLVNGKCEVLKGHCIRSNAGLYFENYLEFAGTLEYILTHKDEYLSMCENGVAYVSENYQWDKIINRISHLINSVTAIE